jgi:hypothetical protein
VVVDDPTDRVIACDGVGSDKPREGDRREHHLVLIPGIQVALLDVRLVDGAYEGLGDAELAWGIPALATELAGEEETLGELAVDRFQVDAVPEWHVTFGACGRDGVCVSDCAVGCDKQIVDDCHGHPMHLRHGQ